MAYLRTTVVNLRKSPYTVYIGRGSKFGNKYVMGIHGSREHVIKRHKEDFCNDPDLQEAVWNELKGKIIGCFCKPEYCHGDTYVAYIRMRMKNDGKPMSQWRKEDIDEFCKKD